MFPEEHSRGWFGIIVPEIKVCIRTVRLYLDDTDELGSINGLYRSTVEKEKRSTLITIFLSHDQMLSNKSSHGCSVNK